MLLVRNLAEGYSGFLFQGYSHPKDFGGARERAQAATRRIDALSVRSAWNETMLGRFASNDALSARTEPKRCS